MTLYEMSKKDKKMITRKKVEALLVARREFLTKLALFVFFPKWLMPKIMLPALNFITIALAMTQKFALVFLFLAINDTRIGL